MHALDVRLRSVGHSRKTVQTRLGKHPWQNIVFYICIIFALYVFAKFAPPPRNPITSTIRNLAARRIFAISATCPPRPTLRWCMHIFPPQKTAPPTTPIWGLHLRRRRRQRISLNGLHTFIKMLPGCSNGRTGMNFASVDPRIRSHHTRIAHSHSYTFVYSCLLGLLVFSICARRLRDRTMHLCAAHIWCVCASPFNGCNSRRATACVLARIGRRFGTAYD